MMNMNEVMKMFGGVENMEDVKCGERLGEVYEEYMDEMNLCWENMNKKEKMEKLDEMKLVVSCMLKILDNKEEVDDSEVYDVMMEDLNVFCIVCDDELCDYVEKMLNMV